MPSTSDLYSNLTNAMSNLQGTPNATANDFSKNVMNQVGNFSNQYKDLGNMDAGLYAAPANMMSNFYSQYGTGANSGIDPMHSLALITGRIGGMQGNRDAYANTLNTAGGGLKSLADSAYQAQQGDLTKQNQNIGYLSNLYQTSNSNDQAEKQRQATIQAANIAAGAQMARLNWEKQQAQLTTPTIGPDGKLVYSDPTLQSKYNNDQASANALAQFNSLKNQFGGQLNKTDYNKQQLINLGAQFVGNDGTHEIYQLGSDPNNRIKLMDTTSPDNQQQQDQHPFQGANNILQYLTSFHGF